MTNTVRATLSLVGLTAILLFTRPELTSVVPIFGFFIFLYCSTYFLSLSILGFLRIKQHTKLAAILVASCATTLQLMITFKAARLLEICLLLIVVTGGIWYFSRAKT